ncbi:MAG: XTP/dITP diphosphatase [Eubacterium sp.]|nr:XTP/dITP diphosphatase [Eubacterium sp.]
MNKLVFATGNMNKLREIKEILSGLDIEVISMKEAGIDVDIVEDGDTFEANALIKARAVCKASGHMAVADDSGLVVDALGGEPGIYSARYMGEDTSYDIKNQAIIDRLNGVPDEERSARFVCAAALVLPDGREYVFVEAMEGRIGYEIAGQNGFGYDPIFYLPEYGKTSAEISPDEKNAISHRGKAMRKMADFLRGLNI